MQSITSNSRYERKEDIPYLAPVGTSPIFIHILQALHMEIPVHTAQQFFLKQYFMHPTSDIVLCSEQEFLTHHQEQKGYYFLYIALAQLG